MSITLITGKPGTGKTVFAISSFLKDNLEKKRIVYTLGIPDLKFPHIELTKDDLNKWHDSQPVEGRPGVYELTTLNEDSLIIVDEAADVWPSIHLKVIPEFLQYLRKHRKHAMDFLLITQDPHFLHPHVLLNVDRHIHLMTDWRGTKSYEWPEYCLNPILPSNQSKAVSKPYKLDKSVFSQFYSATKHLEKPKRAIPKMVFVALCMVVAIPAMGAYVYNHFSEKVASYTVTPESETIESIKDQSIAEVKLNQTVDSQPIVNLQRQSLSMVSELVDWSQVAACLSSKTNCVCYGHQAQRLNIPPDTCNAAIQYGWIRS
mgnify:CR=1 FL=1